MTGGTASDDRSGRDSTDLAGLIAGLEPVRNPGVFVFVTTPPAVPPGVEPVLTFQEAEGRTLILREDEARAVGLAGVFPSAWITLQVRSSLAAVGLLAAVTGCLARAGIACNAVSAYHHDHLFVPHERGDEAVEVLRRL